jgi:predicted TIM-barrel fold metal-dependent hydrolase
MIAEVPFYGMRNFVHMLLSGVFERFPAMKFVITEAGAAQFRSMLSHLDGIITRMRAGSIGELKYEKGAGLPQTATEYFRQNVWLGASFPGPADVAARHLLPAGRFMWGSDYPHDEGTGPYTREHLRQVMIDVPVEEKRRILGLNAAELYDFDVDALAPLVAEFGPTVDELQVPLDELPEDANQALLQNA